MPAVAASGAPLLCAADVGSAAQPQAAGPGLRRQLHRHGMVGLQLCPTADPQHYVWSASALSARRSLATSAYAALPRYSTHVLTCYTYEPDKLPTDETSIGQKSTPCPAKCFPGEQRIPETLQA